MHRSRIGVVLIDHSPETFGPAARFWSAAVGGDVETAGEVTEDDPYQPLPSLAGGIKLELQRLAGAGAARIHVDVETDDVPAETARLVAAGAGVVTTHDKYVVLEDPGGLVFCVVPVQTGAEFDTHARTWE